MKEEYISIDGYLIRAGTMQPGDRVWITDGNRSSIHIRDMWKALDAQYGAGRFALMNHGTSRRMDCLRQSPANE